MQKGEESARLHFKRQRNNLTLITGNFTLLNKFQHCAANYLPYGVMTSLVGWEVRVHWIYNNLTFSHLFTIKVILITLGMKFMQAPQLFC